MLLVSVGSLKATAPFLVPGKYSVNGDDSVLVAPTYLQSNPSS